MMRGRVHNSQPDTCQHPNETNLRRPTLFILVLQNKRNVIHICFSWEMQARRLQERLQRSQHPAHHWPLEPILQSSSLTIYGHHKVRISFKSDQTIKWASMRAAFDLLSLTTSKTLSPISNKGTMALRTHNMGLSPPMFLPWQAFRQRRNSHLPSTLHPLTSSIIRSHQAKMLHIRQFARPERYASPVSVMHEPLPLDVAGLVLQEWDSHEWHCSSDALADWLNARWAKTGYRVSKETVCFTLRMAGRNAQMGLGDAQKGRFYR